MKSFATALLTSLLAASLTAVAAPWASAQPETWDQIKAAGQAEGSIVFRTGASETKQYRQWLPQLEKEVGLKIQLVTGSSSSLAAKAVMAQKAGKPIADLWIGGPMSITNVFVPAGVVQDIKPLLVLPEVTDPTVWFGDAMPWASEWTLAYAADANRGMIVINPKLVDPNDFNSYWDILDPKWKGKIVLRDPRGDGVESPRTFYYAQLGQKFYTELFDQMKPTIAPDARTAVEWVAREKFSFCIIGCNRSAELAEADGLSVKAEFPKILKEGIPVDMGGNGLSVMSNPPHPAATKYFVNWFLSREGQIYYQKITGNFSLRKDIPRDGVDPDKIMRPEEAPYNWYGWKYPEPREQSQVWLREMMKTRGY